MGPLKLGPMPARAEGASAAAAVSEVRASENAIGNREGKNGFMVLSVTSPAWRWEAGNRQPRRPPAHPTPGEAAGFTSIGDGGHRGFLEGVAHGRVVAVGKTGALNHQYQDQILLRVGPALGGVGAAVAEGAGRERRRNALRFPDDLEAEAPAHAAGEAGFDVAALGPGHQRQRFPGDYFFAVERAAVEGHLVEAPHVGRGGEQAAGRKRGALAVAQAAFDKIDVGLLQTVTGLCRPVGFGQALDLAGCWPEGGVLHAEGLEDAALEKLLEFAAGLHFD